MMKAVFQTGLPHAIWRELVCRGFDRLTLDQMHRLKALMLKMGWQDGVELPVEALMAQHLTEAEQAEFLEIDAAMAKRAA